MHTKIETLQFKDKIDYSSFAWILLLFVPLVSFIPQPATQFGHPWKVELVSSILFLGLILFKKKFFENFSVSNADVLLILFIIWSAVSTFWAESWRSVWHHTIVWGIYFLYFIYQSQIIESKKLLKLSIKAVTIYVLITCFACLTEYFLFEQTTIFFRLRYASISETWLTLFPIFVAFALFCKGKNFIYSLLIASLIWVSVIISSTRTSLICLAISAILLFTFFLFRNISLENFKRVSLISALFIFSFLGINYYTQSDNNNIYNRLTIETKSKKEENENIPMRLLLWKVASLEMFKNNPIIGVGADNFALEFNNYRKNYAEKFPNDEHLSTIESYMPERNHNEFLQVLVELGLIGFLLLIGFFLINLKKILKDTFDAKNKIQIALKIGSLIGLISFLISSMTTSFSFRAMQNGIIFFFVLALALRENKPKKAEAKQFFSLKPFQPIFVGATVLACCVLITLTSLQIYSNYQLSIAEKELDFDVALPIYQKSAEYNPDNAAAIFSIGIRYYADKKPIEAIPYMQAGIKKGLGVSIAHFYLASAQKNAGFTKEAQQTIENALKIYPRSLFLRNYHIDLLKLLGETEAAEKEWQIAKNQDELRAEVWNSLISVGAEETTYKIRDNKNLPDIMDLQPYNAILAVTDEHNLYKPKRNDLANLFNQNK